MMNNNFAQKAWVFVVFLFPLVFLFMPKMETENHRCLRDVSYKGQVLFIHNCDSKSIAESALNFPGYLVDEQNPWRGRPLHIAFGAFSYNLLTPFVVIIEKTIADGIDFDYGKRSNVQKKSVYFSVYLSYLILHIALILFLILVVSSFLNIKNDALNKFLLAVFIMNSDFIQGFFWQPHSSFFGIFIPIIAILAFQIGFMSKIYTKKQLLICCVLLGSGVLIYQSTILWLPMFLCGFFYAASTEKEKVDWKIVRSSTLCFLLPLLVWFAVNMVLDKPYSYEAGLGQFIWIVDALKNGHLMESMATKFHEFLGNIKRSLGNLWIVPLVLLIGSVTFNPEKLSTLIRQPFLVACVLIIVGQLVFNFLQGYYQPRFITPLLPLVSLMSLWLISRSHAGSLKYALFILSLAQIVSGFYSPSLSMT